MDIIEFAGIVIFLHTDKSVYTAHISSFRISGWVYVEFRRNVCMESNVVLLKRV